MSSRLIWFVVMVALVAVGSQAPTPVLGAARANQQSAPVPTTYELIDQALDAKRITEELAHKYRVFAAFGDSRLPREFHGRITGPEPPPEVMHVGEILSTLSPQTQSDLAPFFMRPDEPGSWITLGTVSDQGPGGPGPDDDRETAHASRSDDRPPLSFAVHFPTAGSRSRRPTGLHRPAAPAHQPSQITWQSFPAAGGKARVWAQDRYPGDAAKARDLANELTNKIWSKLVNHMGMAPVPDTSVVRNGGGPAIDFYLVHAPTEVDRATNRRELAWLGLSQPAIAAVPCFPQRYIQIHSRLPLGDDTSPGMVQVAAHELMHSISFAFLAGGGRGCGDDWIMEASGAWAENFVYPDANSEHPYGKDVQDSPHYPIDDVSSIANHPCRCYGAYLLPFFAQQSSPFFMRDIWKAMRTENALKAINSVLAGGFDKQWPDFLIRNWNRPPIDGKSYKAWDKFATPAIQLSFDIDTRTGPQTQSLDLPTRYNRTTRNTKGLEYLSGWYYHFKFQPSVHTITFENPLAIIRQPHTSLWAIKKTAGLWSQPDDWTNDPRKTFCRDIPREDVEELVIVIGNSDWDTKKVLDPPEVPKLTAYPQGCAAWEGVDTATFTMTANDPRVTISERVVATLKFESDSTYIVPGEPRGYWKLTAGHATWTATFSGVCSGSGSGSVALSGFSADDEVPRLEVWTEGRDLLYVSRHSPWPGDIPSYRVTCPDGVSMQYGLNLALGWWGTDEVNNKVSPDGRTIQGAFADSSSGSEGFRKTTWWYKLNLKP